MDILSGETILLFSLFLHPLLKGVCFSREEFAPLGANSFLEEWALFEELHPPEKQTGIRVVHVCKTDEKQEGYHVSITLFLKKS